MGTLNLGSGSLNVTGNLAVSELHTNTLRHSDGVTRHTPMNIVHKGASTLLNNITWSTAINSTTQDIGSLSTYTTANTYAVNIAHYYVHGHSANNTHSYLTGYVFQKGKNYATHGCYTNQQHYDWYYNTQTSNLTIPWDPNGDQTLQIYVSNAYNSNANNYHAFFMNAIYEHQL